MKTLMIINTAHGGMLFSLTYDGSYNERGYYTYWWTSTEYSDSSGAWCRRIDYNFNQVTLMAMIKYYGLSVRCVKDYY
jgi:uncharacterized protein (TIGR02145 family)